MTAAQWIVTCRGRWAGLLKGYLATNQMDSGE